MRKNAKRLAGAVIAVVMAASLSVTAYAADYAQDPEFPDYSSSSDSSDSSSSSSSGSSSSSASSSASTAATVTSSDISKAIDNAVIPDKASAEKGSSGEGEKAVATVTVASTNNVKVTSSVVKKLAKSDDTVLEIVSPKAVISIDSSTIKKAKSVDLSMKVYGSTSRTTIDMRSKKDFGCEVKITVTTCKLSAKKLAKAHVYCDGEDMGPVEIDEDGNPVITVTKGGKYVIK